METKKIAYTATVYSHLAHFHLPFLRDLREKGYEVHAYAGADALRDEVEQAGVRCVDVPFSRSPLSLGNWAALRQLLGCFRQERYEFIHTHTPNAALITRLAAACAGLRNVVYTAHGFHFYRGAPLLNWLLYYPLERLMARWTDVLITLNEEDYRRAAHFPVRRHALQLPGVGVQLEPIEGPAEEQLLSGLGLQASAARPMIVLCAAELNRNKNQEQLIRAVHELIREGIPVILLLAGAGGWELRCRELVSRLQLEQAVRFLGYRRDIAQWMQAADVVALVSRREGLPKVLLEGLAAGKPLVVTDVRGSRELVQPEENGFVVPVGDYRATAGALRRLYDDPLLRTQMGASSQRKAAKYALDPVRARLEEVYAALLDPGERKGGSQA
ncbi:glycosyltransferase family 1 protein [Paenibacillus sp. CAA11]|uniref:glycosyltransferase family 4 protein n=1 Tax=Paenibacillus sp. CAA11 TaxID=1532905 RepID=UPI000D3B1D13|nr:glycosyltransferase family 4 protein [Paenibacillus sp. CAA11]AWB46406.1 glycosyltransferase family 1 protein [Paenibacillus sp. CAA11]